MSDIPEDVMNIARQCLDEYKGSWPAERLRKAIAIAILTERERSRKALSEAEQRVKDARRVALEEAALWHDQEITSLDEKISENNSYRDRIGAGAGISLANDYCRQLQSQHRLSAAAIRALQSEER